MNEKLRDAMDQISDRYLAEAAAPIHRHHYYPYIAAVAAILVLVLTLGVFLGPLKPKKPDPSPSGNPILQTPMDTTGPTVPSTEELSGTTPIDPTPTTTTRPTYPGTTTVLSSTTAVSTTTPPSYPTHTTVRKPSTMKPTTTSTERVPTATSTSRPAFSSTQKPTTLKPTSTAPGPRPTIASVTTDKTLYTTNEPVTFTISSDGESTALRIIRADGLWEKTWQNVGSSFTHVFDTEGEYWVLVITRIGSNTLFSPDIAITIRNTGILSPTFANIRSDKSSYTPGETVTFTMSSDGETHALWIFKPDGTIEHFADVGTSYAYTPTMPGEYRVLMEAWLGATFCCPEEISFCVVDPSSVA